MDSNFGQALRLHPEVAALRAEIRRFGETLTQIIVQRDYLRHAILPDIAAEYNLKIGHLETRAFWLDCELRALKRRIELAQMVINKGEKPCYQNIERQIAQEFAEWRAQIIQKQRAVEAAREFAAAPKLDSEDSKKLHTLYRNLAKRLHPDVTGEQSERARNLWQQTADAYCDADLATLETLWLIVENQTAAPEIAQPQTLERLREKREKLFAAIVEINDEIARIRRETPYIWQNILRDETEIRRRQLAITNAIKDLQNYRLRLTEHWVIAMQSAKDNEKVPPQPPALVIEETAEPETEPDFPEFIR